MGESGLVGLLGVFSEKEDGVLTYVNPETGSYVLVGQRPERKEGERHCFFSLSHHLRHVMRGNLSYLVVCWELTWPEV